MTRICLNLSLFAILSSCSTFEQKSSNESTSAESEAYFALGLSAYDSGQFASALDFFEKAEKQVPSNTGYQMHSALALMSLERTEESEKKFLAACHSVKEYPDCWNNLSYFYIKTKKPEKAIEYATKAIESKNYTTPEMALSNRARAFILTNKLDMALNDLKKSERIAPMNCNVQLLKAQIFSRKKLYDLAIDSANRAESLCTSDTRTHFWTAYLQQKNNRTDVSQKKLKSMIETFRDEKTVFEVKKQLQLIENRIPLKEPHL